MRDSRDAGNPHPDANYYAPYVCRARAARNRRIHEFLHDGDGLQCATRGRSRTVSGFSTP